MILATLTLFSGLAISAVAIYYSVIGLAAIFAGAVIPIIIMGVILEISKLVAAWWLKLNWKQAPFFLKSYMLIAVMVLMFITSMGIFGFLSKAHIEQGVPTGDIIAQIEIMDQQIALEQTIIAQSRTAILSLDAQIDKYTSLGAVTKGVVARKEQAPERTILATQIKESQTLISKLRRDKIPVSSKLRAVEAEVGPIKYIAQLMYGDNPTATLLEKAVVWVIIVIVFVFDPLAILLLLSAQLSFIWAKESKLKLHKSTTQDEKIDEPLPPIPPDVVEEQWNLFAEKNSQFINNPFDNDDHEIPDFNVSDCPLDEVNRPLAKWSAGPAEETVTSHTPETHAYLRKGNMQGKDTSEYFKPMVHEAEPEHVPPIPIIEENEQLDEEIEQLVNNVNGDRHLSSVTPEPEQQEPPTIFEEPIFEELFTEEGVPTAEEIEPTLQWIDRVAATNDESYIDSELKKKRIDWIERTDGQQVKRTSE